MNLVDSSGWLEYLADGPNAKAFARALEDTPRLVVPTLCICEVFKRAISQRGEGKALQAIALMHQGTVVELTSDLAISAARLGLERGLHLADSIVLATARLHEATLWTQDADFEGLEGVRYVVRSREPRSAPSKSLPSRRKDST